MACDSLVLPVPYKQAGIASNPVREGLKEERVSLNREGESKSA
jgi:hypothetical protein